MEARQGEGGFSLIEALVAMTVLSVAAATLLGAVEEHTRSVAAISERATALWIAENRLVELKLGVNELAQVMPADGREWWISTQSSDTADPDLMRVDISVGPTRDLASPLATLTGFVDRAAGAS